MSNEKHPVAATPMMASVGFSWVDVDVQAKHVIKLLQEHGDSALNVVYGIVKLIKLATSRDLLGVFAQLNQSTVDIQALIQAVKDEFKVD